MLENKVPQQDESKTEKKRGRGRREGGTKGEQYMRVSPTVKGVVSFNYQLQLMSLGTVFLPPVCFFGQIVCNCHTFC